MLSLFFVRIVLRDGETIVLNDLKQAKVFSVGQKSVQDRPVSKWIARAAVLALGLAASTGALAHGASHHHHDESPAVTAQLGTTIQSTFVAPQLEHQSQAGLSWVSGHQIDGSKLLQEWKDGGVRADQAIELLNVLVWTQSPVIATTWEAKTDAENRAQTTRDIFSVKTERNAMFFLNKYSMSKLARSNTVTPVEAANTIDGSDASWNDVQNYWNTLSTTADGSTVVKGTPAQFDAARAELIQAVSETGLSSLRVPLPVWSNAENIQLLAQHIKAANQDMQNVTGWSGKVLGLNNKVSLTVIQPMEASFTYQNSSGDIAISTSWKDLAHEWFHAFQGAHAQDMANTKDVSSMFAFNSQNGLTNSWDGLMNGLKSASDQTGGTWYNKLNAYVNQIPGAEQPTRASWDDMEAAKAYYTSPSEMMAYAWGSYVQSKLPSTSVISPERGGENVADGILAPTVNEAKNMTSVWNKTFAELDQSWYSKNSAPSTLQTVGNDVSTVARLNMASIVAKRKTIQQPSSPEMKM